jgi:hypothetical protein
VIRVYAFVSGLSTALRRPGVGGTPVELRWFEDVGAVVGYDGPQVLIRRDDVVAHGLVVEDAAASALAVLPVRFGELVADERALEDAVHARLAALRRALDAELDAPANGVHVEAPPRRPAPAAAGGAEYLRARLADEAPAAHLHRQLERLVRASRRSGHGDASYLVERTAVNAVRETVERCAVTFPDVSIMVTGPWAPYSFAHGDGS